MSACSVRNRNSNQRGKNQHAALHGERLANSFPARVAEVQQYGSDNMVGEKTKLRGLLRFMFEACAENNKRQEPGWMWFGVWQEWQDRARP